MQPEAPGELAISYFGARATVRPLAAVGMGLQCSGALGSVMVLEHQCEDREAFWRAWRMLGGESQGLAWEDGKPFCVPGDAAGEGMSEDCGDEADIRPSAGARLMQAAGELWAALRELLLPWERNR